MCVCLSCLFPFGGYYRQSEDTIWSLKIEVRDLAKGFTSQTVKTRGYVLQRSEKQLTEVKGVLMVMLLCSLLPVAEESMGRLIVRSSVLFTLLFRRLTEFSAHPDRGLLRSAGFCPFYRFCRFRRYPCRNCWESSTTIPREGRRGWKVLRQMIKNAHRPLMTPIGLPATHTCQCF